MEYHEIKFTLNNTIIATIYSNKNHILVKQIKCIIFIQNLFCVFQMTTTKFWSTTPNISVKFK